MAKKDKESEKEFGAEIDEIDAETLTMAAEGDIGVELTEAEKRKLEADARKEVAKAVKLAKMKEFKAQAKKRLQSEAMFKHGRDAEGNDLVEVQLALASHPKWIMLDGVMYHARAKPYKVTKSVAAVLLDQMDRGWRQEEARRGEKVEFQPTRPSVTLRGTNVAH